MSDQYSIRDLAREVEITSRTLRFYEEEGLLSPSREGQNRVYSRADRTRLRLILRGKRLGLLFGRCVTDCGPSVLEESGRIGDPLPRDVRRGQMPDGLRGRERVVERHHRLSFAELGGSRTWYLMDSVCLPLR